MRGALRSIDANYHRQGTPSGAPRQRASQQSRQAHLAASFIRALPL